MPATPPPHTSKETDWLPGWLGGWSTECTRVWMIILARGRSRIFFRGGTLVSCSTSTPINHTVYFFAEYQLYKKTAGHLGEGGGAHPLHPPPRSAAVIITCLEAFRGNMTLVDIFYWFNLSISPNNNHTFRRSFQNHICLVHLKSETFGHRLKNFKIAVMNYLFSRILSTANLAFWKTNLSNNYLLRYYRRVFSW